MRVKYGSIIHDTHLRSRAFVLVDSAPLSIRAYYVTPIDKKGVEYREDISRGLDCMEILTIGNIKEMRDG